MFGEYHRALLDEHVSLPLAPLAAAVIDQVGPGVAGLVKPPAPFTISARRHASVTSGGGGGGGGKQKESVSG